MCLFRKKKSYPLDIEENNFNPFHRKIAFEINKLREEDLILVEHKLATYLANEHDTKEHDNDNIRRQLIIDNTKYNYVGENVAYGYDDPVLLVSSWKHSPKHYKIMTGNYTHLVVGNNNGVITALFLRV